MAPTIINGANAADKRPIKPVEKRSELICRVKYSNTLPDIPFDLKFLMYPFENDRFIQYNPTSLERSYKYEVLTEHDLGVTVDLINRDLYQADSYAQLDPDDEKLLEEDVHTPQDTNRSRQHSRPVSWLRKSEYISTEQTRFQPQNLETIEAKVGYNVKKSLREETLYLDREAQIKAIEKTFDDTKNELTKHYSKPGVVPVEVLPVYPDFVNWKYPCAQVIFDSDPAPAGKNVPAQIEEMSQAMIRGVMDESGEQFVAYFLPTDETLEKRRKDLINSILYEDDEEYEYKIAREYNWNVKNKASKGYEENYFFVVRQDGVFYNELETRVRLSKRRVKAGQQQNNTKLVVKHRPLDANEHRMQRYREKQLEPPGEEDEEEDEEDEEMEVDEDGKDEQNEREHNDELENNANKKGNDDEESDEEFEQRKRDRKSRSKSKAASRRSASKARSSRSRSGSGSESGSDKSRSRSRSQSSRDSKSRSRSRSTSAESGKSKNASPQRSSKSRSRSKSRTSKSRSKSRSGSESSRSSRSASRESNKSGSRKSRSSSRASSKSGKSNKSGSDSEGSGSESPKSNRSGSSKSGSGSPKSGSGSPKSGSGSPRSRSGSPKSGTESPKSRSGSPSGSGSGSDGE